MMADVADAVPLVRMQNLSKTFGESGVRACQNISLDLYAGEVLALLGENGAGKTTLMRLLAGLESPDAGHISLAGQPWPAGRSAWDQGIALLQQHPPFSPELTLWEHAVLGTEGGWRQHARRTQIQALTASAARWGFRLDWDQSCAAASPLALQKASLTAFFRHPLRVLILDEPTAALPAPEAASLLTEIQAWARAQATAVVLITHKLGEALQFADRIAVLRAGQLVAWVPSVQTTAAQLSAWMFPSTGQAQAIELTPQLVSDQAPVVFETRGTCADFQVRRGEILGLIALRGEGTEALEEELTGMRPLIQGQLFLAGQEVTGWGIGDLRRAGLSYVPSDRLGRGSSPQAPLASNAAPYHVSRLARRGILRQRSLREYFRDLKRRFGLAGESAQKLLTLSGGNIQKLILAREMDSASLVLILAEPAWGLDLEARQELYRLMRQTAQTGTAIVVLSSEPQELAAVCSTMGVLFGGKLQAIAPAADWTPQRLGQALLGVEA